MLRDGITHSSFQHVCVKPGWWGRYVWAGGVVIFLFLVSKQHTFQSHLSPGAGLKQG